MEIEAWRLWKEVDMARLPPRGAAREETGRSPSVGRCSTLNVCSFLFYMCESATLAANVCTCMFPTLLRSSKREQISGYLVVASGGSTPLNPLWPRRNNPTHADLLSYALTEMRDRAIKNGESRENGVREKEREKAHL